MDDRNTVVGVFDDQQHAQQAVRELKRAGFTEAQIGVTAHGEREAGEGASESSGTHAAQGAGIGAAAGAGVGALWGLGVVAGMIPAIGPAIAGGTMAAVLSSAGAGAAAAGLAGTLIGFGVSEEEAEYYEREFHAGRSIVSVHAGGQDAQARAIMQEAGGYDARGGRTEPHAAGTGAAAATKAGPARTGARRDEVEVAKRDQSVERRRSR